MFRKIGTLVFLRNKSGFALQMPPAGSDFSLPMRAVRTDVVRVAYLKVLSGVNDCRAQGCGGGNLRYGYWTLKRL